MVCEANPTWKTVAFPLGEGMNRTHTQIKTKAGIGGRIHDEDDFICFI